MIYSKLKLQAQYKWSLIVPWRPYNTSLHRTVSKALQYKYPLDNSKRIYARSVFTDAIQMLTIFSLPAGIVNNHGFFGAPGTVL